LVRGSFYFSGYVQGVGFRYNACSLAKRFNVTGFVRNLPDGRVELIVEGNKETIQEYVSTLKDSLSSFINEIKETWSEAANEFKVFEVRF
jgi:acylphosphatase